MPERETDGTEGWTRVAETGREFVDSDHRHWRVFEMEYPYDRRRGRVLVFDCAEVVRRVRDYPSNWRELDDTALEELAQAR
ncbi:MAG: hypothetical protein JWO05_3627 [Gemmatimonadetes bacterium]|nr:hypothetical protein [Gemmatimonadota bacterium]